MRRLRQAALDAATRTSAHGGAARDRHFGSEL